MDTNLIRNRIKSKRDTLLRINTPLKSTHNTLQALLSLNDYQRLNRFIIEGLTTVKTGCISKRQCISMSFSLIKRDYLTKGGIQC